MTACTLASPSRASCELRAGPCCGSSCSPRRSRCSRRCSSSSATRCARCPAAAVRSVPLDWQGPCSSAAQAQRAARRSPRSRASRRPRRRRPPRSRASTHTGPAGSTTTATGSILAVPPELLAHIHTFRLLHGSLRPGGVVLDQQMAATLQAQIGDTVTLIPQPGSKPRPYRVTGVALVTAPDQALPAAQPARSARRPRSRPRTSRSCRSGRSQRTLGAALPPVTTASALANSAARRAERRPVAGAGAARPGPARGGQPVRGAHARRPDPLRVERSLPGQRAVRRQPLRLAEHRGAATRSTPRRSTSCSPSPAR